MPAKWKKTNNSKNNSKKQQKQPFFPKCGPSGHILLDFPPPKTEIFQN